MKKTKRILSFILLFVLALGMTFASGCSKKEDPAESVVVTVGDTNITLDEMMYYIYAVEASGQQYEALYQQYYGTSYWDSEYSEGVTMRDQAKSYVMDTAVMYEILYQKAVEAGYTLTDDEKTEAETNVDSILTNMSSEQKKVTGFTKESLTKTMEKLSIAKKYYDELIDGFDIDDEAIKDTIKYDDYRQYNTEYLFASTTKYDENYNTVDLTDEEKEAKKASITAALDKVKAGDEFSAIAEADTNLTTSTTNFVNGDSTADADYEAAAVKLENDGISDIVETASGYYIIKMVDNNSTESYDAAVEDAISSAENDAFETKYEEMKKEYTITENDKVWGSIVIGNTTIVESSTAETSTTGSTSSSTSEATTDTSASGSSTAETSTTGE